MMAATKSHHQEVEDDGDGGDDVSAGTNASSQRDGKNIEQKANSSRSKHSETEQRRRSKINERFQILKDLIPPNDQKRDKASLLLEVIEYIQFLQEKLNMYEGSYQGCNQEPTKLIPWRSNHGHGESFPDHSQVVNNGYGQENNTVQHITNAHSSVEPDFSGHAACRVVEHPSDAATSAVPLITPLQPSMYLSGRSVLPTENLASQPQSRASLGGPSMECSEGLLKSLTQAFLTSGVDLSQASISVQLDIGRRANASLNAMRPAIEGIGKVSPSNQSVAMSGPHGGTEDTDSAAKRARTRES